MQREYALHWKGNGGENSLRGKLQGTQNIVKKITLKVDALAVKKVNDSLTDNLKSRDASASKKLTPISSDSKCIAEN